MAANLHDCPSCGAQLERTTAEADPFPCPFCGYAPPQAEFRSADPQTEGSHDAETLPLPKQQVATLGLETESTNQPAAESAESDAELQAPATPPDAEPSPGPATLRQLTEASEGPAERDDLLEQVPEEMRGVLAARMQAADEAKSKGLRPDTVESLKARGYQVTEDARGARLTGGSARSSDFSPHETVSMAAEQDGGVQPRGQLPICPECQAASPVGATRCQWCDAELPQA